MDIKMWIREDAADQVVWIKTKRQSENSISIKQQQSQCSISLKGTQQKR